MCTDSTTTDRKDAPKLKTILLAAAGGDNTRIDELVNVVKEIASPERSLVIIGHVFDKSSYQETIQQVVNAEDEYIEPDKLAARMTVTRDIIDKFDVYSINYEVHTQYLIKRPT